jgi:hypothetical protein
MNAESTKGLQAGDRVRLRDVCGPLNRGVVTELLPGDYVRVHWDDARIETTHRMYALESDLDPDTATQLVKSLMRLRRALRDE